MCKQEQDELGAEHEEQERSSARISHSHAQSLSEECPFQCLRVGSEVTVPELPVWRVVLPVEKCEESEVSELSHP